MNPFIFLDRDGTLVEDHGYTHKLEDYRLLPGVVEGLTRLAAAGFRFAIVTNQSGIGRGYYNTTAFELFQVHLCDDLRRHGLSIDRTLHCPHLPDANCACRKPRPQLLERAAAELDADLATSWMVGDSAGDVECATRAGCAGSVLVLTGRGQEHSAEVDPAVPRARDLVEAAEIILRTP